MISHPHRFLYVHVPKTGGSSLRRLLDCYGTTLGGERNLDSMYEKHQHARVMRRAMGDEFATYYRFAFVRNPWDWAVSNYEYNRGLHTPYLRGTPYEGLTPAEPFLRDADFASWLRWWTETLRPTQMQMLVDDDGTMLMDEVFRIEFADRAIEILRERLGLPLADIGRLNRSKRRADYRCYYDDATRALAADAFACDVDEFGYTFDPIPDPVLPTAPPQPPMLPSLTPQTAPQEAGS